jgi:hypothetical protein
VSLQWEGRTAFGRGERIRTSDLSVPNRAHYQAVLRPEVSDFDYCNRRVKRLAILDSAGSGGQAFKVGACCGQSARAMTDLILDFDC